MPRAEPGAWPLQAITEILISILGAQISRKETGNNRYNNNTANDTSKISENHNPRLIRKRALDA
jgi:hypothetical protein